MKRSKFIPETKSSPQPNVANSSVQSNSISSEKVQLIISKNNRANEELVSLLSNGLDSLMAERDAALAEVRRLKEKYEPEPKK